MNTLPLSSVRDRFFDPLQQAVGTAVHTRKCQDLSDLDSLKSGVGRCLSPVQSDRDWVQRLYRLLRHRITVNCFFKSLRSERRLRQIKEVNGMLIRQCDRAAVEDPFADHEELADFAIYAADGHYHRRSTHEAAIDGKRRPVGHFFSLNLRSRSLRHLDIARPDRARGKKTEHDISALKRLGYEALRMGQAAGRQMNPLLVSATKPTQRSLQFLRWLTTELTSPTPWQRALHILRALMREYMR